MCAKKHRDGCSAFSTHGQWLFARQLSEPCQPCYYAGVTWERVHTINSFWDGPRFGVADVSGLPHIYDSPFSESKDDFEDYFLVSPIDAELLALVLEDWEIWIRWSGAFNRGDASRDTHPALPEDRARHDELKNMIGTRFQINPVNSRKLMGKFRSVHKGWNGMEVEWEPEC